MRFRFAFPVIVFFSFLVDAAAQPSDILVQRFSLEEGLAQTTVNTILQDRQGFLWLGTTDGLNRYDGYQFLTFRHNSRDSTSLSDNSILAMCEDSDGTLWIGTSNGGLNCYSPHTGIFKHYQHTPDDPASLSNNSVLSLCADTNALWIGTHNGLNRLDRKTGATRRIVCQADGIPYTGDETISSLMLDHSGTLWVSIQHLGLFMFDRETESCGPFSRSITAPVNSLVEDQNGILWIGTGGAGILAFDRAREQFTTYRHDPHIATSLSSDVVATLYIDATQTLWIGTEDGGLNRLAKNGTDFISYRNSPSDINSISYDVVWSIVEDKSGNLWVGTNGGGVNKIRRRKFLHYAAVPNMPGTLSSSMITALDEDSDGNVWVGTEGGGVQKLIRKKQVFQRFPQLPIATHPLYVDRSGTLWLGTMQEGLVRFEENSGQIQTYRHDPHVATSISSNSIIYIFEDRSKTLWVGTRGGGLNRLNADRKSFTRFMHATNVPGTLSDNYVTFIYEDRPGNLWVSTNSGGLNRFEKSTSRFTQFMHDPHDTLSISHNSVYGILEDDAGILWIATYGGGLNRFDPGNGTFRHFTDEQGLPSNSLYGMLKDGNGNLWISTNNGLSRFNPRTLTFTNFDTRDGLQSNEFNHRAYLALRTGEFVFGGVNGFNLFHPDSIGTNTSIPPVVFTDFRIFEQPVPQSRFISTLDNITLSPEENVFSFEFAALDFTAPTKNRYAYQLEGFDKDWVDAGNHRYARYTHLDPGRYVFRVKGSNSDGVWNNAGASISLSVLPPYYLTWWFRMGIVFAVGGLLYFLYRMRMQRLLAMERMRVRIASDLHDDVGSTLTKISLYTDLLKGDPTTPELIDKIGSMSREIISSMSDIVWTIDARNDTLGDLIDRINDFALSVLPPKGIHVTFNHDGVDMATSLSVDHRQNIYLILKEAVNNMAKHSCATTATVSFTSAGGILTATVRDNGKGIGSRSSQGHGLRNITMRAERIHAHLEISNEAGTTIRLKTTLR